ncbi:GNAT family N-acetyltransferase [Aquimarina aquimarini]|uniref:GNAT family N-acetyltransferase n=1 Tax=Aquimarina aquimarini TaxID=1191734 RepID=UPI000D5556D3|nr:GNAT family N-acetyltransferase [Aquimarina aquimarini]
MNNSIKIKKITKQDWPSISAIYQEGIDTGIATFETKVPTWKNWNISHIKPCRFKAIIDNCIAGWIALSPASKRKVYQGVAEISIYITSEYRGLGIGRLLLSSAIEESENVGIWTLQAGIFSQNKASISLHTSLGFRIIGYREKIAQLNGIWYDNTILERRSNII